MVGSLRCRPVAVDPKPPHREPGRFAPPAPSASPTVGEDVAGQDHLTETLAGGDVIGRASDELRKLIEGIIVTWDAGAGVHYLDLAGDLVRLLAAGDNKKAATLSGAACSLKLVAGN